MWWCHAYKCWNNVHLQQKKSSRSALLSVHRFEQIRTYVLWSTADRPINSTAVQYWRSGNKHVTWTWYGKICTNVCYLQTRTYLCLAETLTADISSRRGWWKLPFRDTKPVWDDDSFVSQTSIYGSLYSKRSSVYYKGNSERVNERVILDTTQDYKRQMSHSK